MQIIREDGEAGPPLADELYQEMPGAVRRIFGRYPHVASIAVEPLGGIAGEYRPLDFAMSIDSGQDQAISRWLAGEPGHEQAVAYGFAVLLHEAIHALWPDYDRSGSGDGLIHTLSEGLTDLTAAVFFPHFVTEVCAPLGRDRVWLPGPGHGYPALVVACRLVVEHVCTLTGAQFKPKLRELAMWGFGSTDGALAAMSGELVETLGMNRWAVLRRLRADHAIVEALREPLAELAEQERTARHHHADLGAAEDAGRHYGRLAIERLDAVLAQYPRSGRRRAALYGS